MWSPDPAGAHLVHAREVTPGVDRPDVNALSLEPSGTTYRSLDGHRRMTRSVPFLDYVVDGTPLRVMLRDAGYDNAAVSEAAAEALVQRGDLPGACLLAPA